jgi:hypothetical protein
VTDLGVEASGGSILLKWTPKADAFSYNVYRDTKPDFTPDKTGGGNRVATGVNNEDLEAEEIQWIDSSDTQGGGNRIAIGVNEGNPATRAIQGTNSSGGVSAEVAANYFYVVTVVDSEGNESDPSNKVSTNEASSADASLAVELSSFTALADYTEVILKWETGSELGNLGFHVYRSEIGDGPFKKISELIEGAGNLAIGHTYEYLDQKVQPGKTYFYYLEDVDIHGSRNKSNMIQVTLKPLPKEYRLFQNYPNPFNPETWIPFQLPKANEVNIHIYNVTGEPVKTIPLGHKQAGVYVGKAKAAYWDGRNDMGEKLASGVYFYELQTETFRTIRRMMLLK